MWIKKKGEEEKEENTATTKIIKTPWSKIVFFIWIFRKVHFWNFHFCHCMSDVFYRFIKFLKFSFFFSVSFSPYHNQFLSFLSTYNDTLLLTLIWISFVCLWPPSNNIADFFLSIFVADVIDKYRLICLFLSLSLSIVMYLRFFSAFEEKKIFIYSTLYIDWLIDWLIWMVLFFFVHISYSNFCFVLSDRKIISFFRSLFFFLSLSHFTLLQLCHYVF